MDGERFDEIVRGLVGTSTRRRLVATLVAALPLGAFVGRDESEAKGNGKPKDGKKGKKGNGKGRGNGKGKKGNGKGDDNKGGNGTNPGTSPPPGGGSGTVDPCPADRRCGGACCEGNTSCSNFSGTCVQPRSGQNEGQRCGFDSDCSSNRCCFGGCASDPECPEGARCTTNVSENFCYQAVGADGISERCPETECPAGAMCGGDGRCYGSLVANPICFTNDPVNAPCCPVPSNPNQGCNAGQTCKVYDIYFSECAG